MPKSLLFIPDISGFTNFVQSTEAEHSQHVIAELLEILISANTQNLELAEVEGDALFFYKEESIPSQEKLLAQIESMFTAFHGHLKRFEKNRICLCNACAKAPQLELKIIAHCCEIQFINVQGKRKPFGQAVIETHRLLKNNIESDNYVIISNLLAEELKIPLDYKSKLFTFEQSAEEYDNKKIEFIYSKIENTNLDILPYENPKLLEFQRPPNISSTINISANSAYLLEVITNFKLRHHWVSGADRFDFNDSEINQLGTEHVCVINGKNLDFITVSKEGKKDEIVYGEMTQSPPIVDKLYQFWIIEPITTSSSKLTVEIYWDAKSPIKKLVLNLFAKKKFSEKTTQLLKDLKNFTEDRLSTSSTQPELR